MLGRKQVRANSVDLSDQPLLSDEVAQPVHSNPKFAITTSLEPLVQLPGTISEEKAPALSIRRQVKVAQDSEAVVKEAIARLAIHSPVDRESSVIENSDAKTSGYGAKTLGAAT